MSANEIKKYNDKEVIELWLGLENIPADENQEYIDDDYFIWKKGTLISEILAWFNNNYSKGVKELWLDS